MKKGAWARSGVHLFSFPPPQSEEGPAGGLRAASFVTLNVLQPPPVLLSRCLRDLMRERAPGSYHRYAYIYVCVRTCARLYVRYGLSGSPLQEYISGIMGNSIEQCTVMIYRCRHP